MTHCHCCHGWNSPPITSLQSHLVSIDIQQVCVNEHQWLPFFCIEEFNFMPLIHISISGTILSYCFSATLYCTATKQNRMLVGIFIIYSHVIDILTSGTNIIKQKALLSEQPMHNISSRIEKVLEVTAHDCFFLSSGISMV